MVVLPGVLGCRSLRRTVQVRLGTNPAVPRDELPGTRRKRLRCAWHSHLRGLATAIHAISELDEDEQDGGAKVWGEVQVLDVSSCFFVSGP